MKVVWIHVRTPWGLPFDSDCDSCDSDSNETAGSYEVTLHPDESRPTLCFRNAKETEITVLPVCVSYDRVLLR